MSSNFRYYKGNRCPFYYYARLCDDEEHIEGIIYYPDHTFKWYDQHGLAVATPIDEDDVVDGFVYFIKSGKWLLYLHDDSGKWYKI